MNAFSRLLSAKIESYIRFRCSFGHAYESQASTLRTFARFVTEQGDTGPLTQALALAFVLSCDVTPNVRARRYGVIRNFADYLSVFDPRTKALDLHALLRMDGYVDGASLISDRAS